jgi:hypothetical protein
VQARHRAHLVASRGPLHLARQCLCAPAPSEAPSLYAVRCCCCCCCCCCCWRAAAAAASRKLTPPSRLNAGMTYRLRSVCVGLSTTTAALHWGGTPGPRLLPCELPPAAVPLSRLQCALQCACPRVERGCGPCRLLQPPLVGLAAAHSHCATTRTRRTRPNRLVLEFTVKGCGSSQAASEFVPFSSEHHQCGSTYPHVCVPDRVCSRCTPDSGA